MIPRLPGADNDKRIFIQFVSLSLITCFLVAEDIKSELRTDYPLNTSLDRSRRTKKVGVASYRGAIAISGEPYNMP